MIGVAGIDDEDGDDDKGEGEGEGDAGVDDADDDEVEEKAEDFCRDIFALSQVAATNIDKYKLIMSAKYVKRYISK